MKPLQKRHGSVKPLATSLGPCSTWSNEQHLVQGQWKHGSVLSHVAWFTGELSLKDQEGKTLWLEWNKVWNRWETRYSWLVLACKHNVSDSILYDCRRKPSNLFKLHRLTQARRMLARPSEETTDVSNGKPIRDHYTDFLSGKVEKYYIYATTDCSISSRSHHSRADMPPCASCKLMQFYWQWLN